MQTNNVWLQADLLLCVHNANTMHVQCEVD